MHYVDGIFVIVFCVFLLFGFRGGIIRGVVAVLSLVVGLVLATRSMHRLGEMLTGMWDVHEVVGAVLAFVIVFMGIVIAQILVVVLLGRRSDPPRLSSRLFGALLGVIEGAIYLSVILIILNLYSIPSAEVRNQSVLYRPVRNFAPFVFDSANYFFAGSTSFYDELKRSFEKLRIAPLD